MESNKKIATAILIQPCKERFRKNLINLLAQTLFKDGNLEIIVVSESSENIKELNSINKWFHDSNIVSHIVDLTYPEKLRFAVERANSDLIFFSFEEIISLRPDALNLMSSYLLNNSFVSAVYTDVLLSPNAKDVFQNTKTTFASLFPNEISLFSEFESLLPPFLLVRKNTFRDLLSKIKNKDTFQKEFWKNVFERKIQADKLDIFLGLKFIDIDEQEYNDFQNPLFEKRVFDKIVQKFGNKNIQIVPLKILQHLPYHFSNSLNDLVSICLLTPEKASEEDIYRCLLSIQHQSSTNIEIIKSTRKFLENEEVELRNLMWEIAVGKYICYLYAGDEITPNCISKLIQLSKHPQTDLFIYCDFYDCEQNRIIQLPDYSFDKLKKFNLVSSFIFLQRQTFLLFGGFDASFPTFYSIWELLLRIAKNGISGLRIPEPLHRTKLSLIPSYSENILIDIENKAKIIEKHSELFTEMQKQWAQSTLKSVQTFDNSKIPFGIIPNNALLSKILIENIGEETVEKSQKILFVMFGWKDSGGGTTLPRAIAQELANKGWNVSVFYASLKFDPNKPLYFLETHQEGKIKLFGVANRPGFFNDPENPEREISDPNIEKLFKETLELLQPDLIHFHNLHGLTLSLPKIAKEYKIPCVFTPHNYYLIDPELYMIKSDRTLWHSVDFFENSSLIQKLPNKREFFRKRQELTKDLINKYFDLVLAVSRPQQEVLSEFSENGNNIIVVHQASPIVDKLWKSEQLNLESTRKLQEKLRFAYIGSVIPLKNVELIVKAAQHFLPNDVEFNIYGFASIKYLEELKKIDKKNIVNFKGEYTLNQLEEIATLNDIGIVSTLIKDCAPLVLLEMNAMRLPIIAPNIGGIPDFVVNGVNGFLYDYNSVDSLVTAIQYCNLNSETIEKMRNNLEPIHSFESFVNHLEKIYIDLIDNKIKNPKDYELTITNKLLSKKKLETYRFTEQAITELDVKEVIRQLGFEVLKLEQTKETKDNVYYTIEVKIRKPLSLEEFIEESSLLFKEAEPKDYEIAKEQESSQTKLSETQFDEVSPKVQEESLFDLKDLESIVFGTKKVSDEQKEGKIGLPFSTEEDKEKYTEIKPELNIVWEGSQFVYHSLALINREHCSNIIDSGVAELTIIPYESEQFLPDGNPKYEKLRKYDIRYKKETQEEIKRLPYIWIRHQWPPKSEPPKGAKWIIIQPWEFTTLPRRFFEFFQYADELWVPSNYTRQAFLNSGLPFNKVQVIPNGIDPDLFKPAGPIYPLQTNKKLKFLFVGGTIYRKGFDVLLQSYLSAFNANDDVALVVKDMGTESFYKKLATGEEMVEKVKNTSNAPEIIYIKEYLNEEEMASLYRACDVFVSPYRGEGFSLPTLEAMACGLPVIVTEGGATEDFVLDSFAWKIPSYKISIGNEIDQDPLVGESFLLEPDVDYLTSLMQAIYQNPADIVVRGILASSYARTYWTWKRSTMKLLSRVDALYGKNLAQKAMHRLRDKQDSLILLGNAEELFFNGKLEEAKKILEQVIANINSLPAKFKVFTLLRCGIIEILSGRHNEAIKYLEEIEKISPNNIDSLYLRARIEVFNQNLIEALESYTSLVSRWNNEKFNSVLGNSLDLILVDIANIFLELNDKESAIKLFTEAIKLNQNNASAYIGSAKCFVLINEKEEAKRMLEWALKLEPENEEAKSLFQNLENN
ncbi:MAG: glycosyltransferase [Ignavibacteria bacterium]|nr:glycosyltransferase [Ignavibacteria bacterium]